MIRLGLIGCGVVASYGHLPAILETPGLSIQALLDVDPATLEQTQRRFNVPRTFTDVDAFFGSDIDAVVICSPAPVHFRDVMKCVQYKKPALCEKPLAMSEGDIQQMIDAMAAANLPLYTGFTYRFAPIALDIHRLIREGEIGQVRSMRLIYVWDCHGKYNERGRPASGLYDRRVGRMLEGGPMVDCGVHQIDLARWWTGSDVKRVTGVGAWVESEGYHFPDHVYLHMDHDTGAHATVEISFTYGHTAAEPRCEFEYELIGTDGLIRYNRQTRAFECVNGRGTRALNWTEEKNFHGMYREFEQALRTGNPGQMPTGNDGLAATRIAASQRKVPSRGGPVRRICERFRAIASTDTGETSALPTAKCEREAGFTLATPPRRPSAAGCSAGLAAAVRGWWARSESGHQCRAALGSGTPPPGAPPGRPRT